MWNCGNWKCVWMGIVFGIVEWCQEMVGLSLEILFGNGEMTWNEFEVSLDRFGTFWDLFGQVTNRYRQDFDGFGIGFKTLFKGCLIKLGKVWNGLL